MATAHNPKISEFATFANLAGSSSEGSAVEEIPQLAHDLAMALDPSLMAERIGLRPDPWQRDVLRSSAPRLLLNCCRQSGKSTTTAVLACHTALYQPGSLTLCLSPGERQSKELLRKVLDTYRRLGRPVPAEAENKLELELSNGSRIIALPGAEHTIRGYSGVRLLVVDEAARVPNDLYLAVRPMLAVSGGRLLGLSTPFGTRGWWYEAWLSSEPWERYEVPAPMCPRISPEFLEEEQRTLGEWWYLQEYFCRFMDAETSAFRRDDIDRAFAKELETWDLIPSLSV